MTMLGGPYYHPYLGLALPECCGRNSVAECLLPKQKVVGSNPIARSNPAYEHRDPLDQARTAW